MKARYGAPEESIAHYTCLRTRERIAKVISRQTGRKVEQVLADMERDHWMNAEEAVAYGIVSRIIEQQKDLG